MRVVLTRPEQEAADWEQALRRHGHEVLSLALIAIGTAPDAAALAHARRDLDRFAAVMFVSGNAVRGLLGAEGFAWPSGTRAWATGPGTVDRGTLPRTGSDSRPLVAWALVLVTSGAAVLGWRRYGIRRT